MKILTVAQAAEFLQVSQDTLYPMIARGQIPAAKVCGQWRLIDDDLVEWLRGQYELQKGTAHHTIDPERLSGELLSAACAKALAPMPKSKRGR